jgi:predicted O-methyltransferase YrrM
MPRRMNIFLLFKYFLGHLPPGHVVEYGSYRGGSAIFMAHLAMKLHPGMKIYALDTYEGMPETDPAADAHSAGDFGDADFQEISDYVARTGLDNLVLVKGLFHETNDRVMAEAGSVRLAHIDCDIKNAVEYSYDAVKPHMVEGGYYVFDDATASSCIGATEVVETCLMRRDGLNSEQIWPHFVFRHFG